MQQARLGALLSVRRVLRSAGGVSAVGTRHSFKASAPVVAPSDSRGTLLNSRDGNISSLLRLRGIALRHLSWAAEDEDPVVEEKLHRVKKLARLRYNNACRPDTGAEKKHDSKPFRSNDRHDDLDEQRHRTTSRSKVRRVDEDVDTVTHEKGGKKASRTKGRLKTDEEVNAAHEKASNKWKEPVQNGPIDGRAYADWGKIKWRPLTKENEDAGVQPKGAAGSRSSHEEDADKMPVSKNKSRTGATVQRKRTVAAAKPELEDKATKAASKASKAASKASKAASKASKAPKTSKKKLDTPMKQEPLMAGAVVVSQELPAASMLESASEESAMSIEEEDVGRTGALDISNLGYENTLQKDLDVASSELLTDEHPRKLVLEEPERLIISSAADAELHIGLASGRQNAELLIVDIPTSAPLTSSSLPNAPIAELPASTSLDDVPVPTSTSLDDVPLPTSTSLDDVPTPVSTSESDLLKFAVSLLRSSESQTEPSKPEDDPLKECELILPKVKVEGWKASYRDKVERALVDKGLVLEASAYQQILSKEQVTVSDESSVEVVSSVTDEVNSDEDSDSMEWADDLDDSEGTCDLDGTKEESNDCNEVALESSNQFDEEEEVEANQSTSDKISPNLDAFDEDIGQQTATIRAKALFEAIDCNDEGDESVLSEHQKSLKVGIIGAPNAGKSSLLNFLVGTKVSAVSRKTNTTRNEILGVLTESDTQLLFYDTPGLMVDWKGQAVRQDTKNRVQSAWMVTDHCEVLIVLVDAHRHVERPDLRVRRLIDKLGAKPHPSQKRVLCLNKVDLIRNKRELVPLAQEFGGLPGFDRVFMISGLRGGGVRHLKEYLMDAAVLRPWEEERGVVTDMSPIMVAKEVVWEHILDNLHQELPYELRHRHVSWKVLKDKSIRIEQQLLVQSDSQKKILVGKNGGLIRKIGMSAHDELCARFHKTVHLILDVKVSTDNLYAVVENEPEEMWM